MNDKIKKFGSTVFLICYHERAYAVLSQYNNKKLWELY